MRELFVYYRVEAEHAKAALTEVRQLQASLCARHAGLHARLLRRPVECDGPQTWMETYACPDRPEGVSPALQDDIARAATVLQAHIAAPRHCEVFEPL